MTCLFPSCAALHSCLGHPRRDYNKLPAGWSIRGGNSPNAGVCMSTTSVLSYSAGEIGKRFHFVEARKE